MVCKENPSSPLMHNHYLYKRAGWYVVNRFVNERQRTLLKTANH